MSCVCSLDLLPQFTVIIKSEVMAEVIDNKILILRRMRMLS